jgi:phospholipase C
MKPPQTYRIVAAAITVSFAVAAAGCRGASGISGVLPPQAPSIASTGIHPDVPWSGKIEHVIIIDQENRSVDNLFNGFPGADTQSWGLDHNNKRVYLIQISGATPYDISHTHYAFTTAYNNGKLNGWDLEPVTGCKPTPGVPCPPKNLRAYGIVPRAESKPYWDMATQFTLGDRMFQTNEGPSFPSHQYIISGTSTISTGSPLRASENPINPQGKITGGCDSPKGSLVKIIDAAGNENQKMYPCFQRLTLMDLLNKKGVGWHYYQFSYQPNLWNAVDAIKSLSESKYYHGDVAAPSSRVLTDILNGDLDAVTWVTPDKDDSDHALVSDGSGPSWVSSIVNAIGTSPRYWKNSVIILTWDDWGGWYDHVKPPVYNSYELGFRVPIVVMSPYAKKAYVSHVQHEFGSILKFVEETFGLGSLGTTDVRADDLSDFFDFNQKPRKFVPIHSPIGPMYFINKPASQDLPDDDF